MATYAVPVSGNQIVLAKKHIENAIEAGRNSTDVDLTASGCLLHVLMDLGIVLDVINYNEGN